jgi:hypothetical protein
VKHERTASFIWLIAEVPLRVPLSFFAKSPRSHGASRSFQKDAMAPRRVKLITPISPRFGLRRPHERSRWPSPLVLLGSITSKQLQGVRVTPSKGQCRLVPKAPVVSLSSDRDWLDMERGRLLEPVRNGWTSEFGLTACDTIASDAFNMSFANPILSRRQSRRLRRGAMPGHAQKSR